jgi:hypothetical protein
MSGLEHVSKCREISNLDIDYNHQIDDEALPLLLKLTKMRTLSVKETKISLIALESLGQHGVIVNWLCLNRSAITRQASSDELRRLFHIIFLVPKRLVL